MIKSALFSGTQGLQPLQQQCNNALGKSSLPGLLLNTPDFSPLELERRLPLKNASVGAVIGGVVDKIQGLSAPTASLSFLKATHAYPFTLPPGVTKTRQKSVGRWHRADAQRFPQPSLAGFNLGEKDRQEHTEYLHKLNEEIFPSLEVKPDLFLFLSDSEPFEFIKMLDTVYPDALKVRQSYIFIPQQMGLLASQMHFITGEDACLYASQSVFPGGIVGYALSTKKPLNLQVVHPSLEPLGEPVQISQSRGNVILKLADDKAAKTLIDHSNQDSGSKNQSPLTFYLALLDQKNVSLG